MHKPYPITYIPSCPTNMPPPPPAFLAPSVVEVFLSPRISPPRLVETHTQSGSRSPCWNGSARTNQASTEPLNISQSIASLFKPLGCLMLSVYSGSRVRCFEQVRVFRGPQNAEGVPISLVKWGWGRPHITRDLGTGVPISRGSPYRAYTGVMKIYTPRKYGHFYVILGTPS